MNILNLQGNIRSLDFNPNKQYLLATAGDDGMVVVWDTRETKSPLHSSLQHNHWVWSVRYNCDIKKVVVVGI